MLNNKIIRKFLSLALSLLIASNCITIFAQSNSSSNIIYTKYINSGQAIGNGTKNSPFKNLEDAINNAKNGDTIVILDGGAYLNEFSNSNGSPFIIDKNLTIKSEGETPQVLQTRFSGIILGADLKLQNVKLAMSNPVNDHIFVNGHSLTLENVTIENHVRKVDIFGGEAYHKNGTLIQGFNAKKERVLAKKGNKSKITINNSKVGIGKFGKVFAGSMNHASDIPVEIIIGKGISSYNDIEGLSLVGADESTVDKDNFLDTTEPATPVENEKYKVNAIVDVKLNKYFPKAGIDGKNSASVNLELTPNEYGFSDVSIKNVNKLKINGLVRPKELIFKNDEGVIDISNKTAELDLTFLKNKGRTLKELKIKDLIGGGKLNLNKDSLLNISDSVTGKTDILIGGWNGQSTYIQLPSKTYIKTATNVSGDSFKYIPNSSQPNAILNKNAQGEWNVIADTQNPMPEVNTLPVYLESEIGLESTNTIKITVDAAIEKELTIADKDKFKVELNNEIIDIVNIIGEIDYDLIDIEISRPVYKNDVLTVAYEGDKLVPFKETVTNNIETERPPNLKPAIKEAKVEDNSKNEIKVILNEAPKSTINNKEHWEVISNEVPQVINTVSNNGANVTISLAKDLEHSSNIKLKYKGDAIEQGEHNVINNIAKPPVVEKPIYESGIVLDKNRVQITLNKEIDSAINNETASFILKKNNKTIAINSIKSSGKTITLSTNETIAKGDAIKLQYNGQYIEHFQEKEITNNLAEVPSYVSTAIHKENKSVIEILLNNLPISEINLNDKQFFAINKNGVNLQENEITNIQTLDNKINITLKTPATSQDTFNISYSGDKIKTFDRVQILNNIKPEIISGNIEESAKNTIILNLDELLKENISNTDLSDFNVSLDNKSLEIKNIEGKKGEKLITITLAKPVYKNSKVRLIYNGDKLISSNISIANNVITENNNLIIQAINTGTGYTSNFITLSFNKDLGENELTKEMISISTTKRTRLDIIDLDKQGENVTLRLNKNLNYKDNIILNINDKNNKIEPVLNQKVDNKLFDLAGFDVTEEGKIVLNNGEQIKPRFSNIAPIVNGAYNITIPKGAIIENRDSSSKIKVGDDLKLSNKEIVTEQGIKIEDNRLKLPNGNTIIPNKGEIKLENGKIELENGGSLISKDGKINQEIKAGEEIPIEKEINNNSNNSYNTGNSVIINDLTITNKGTAPEYKEPILNKQPVHWAVNVSEKLKSLGIIERYTIKELNQNITRGEFSKLIYNLLEKDYNISFEKQEDKFNDLSNVDEKTKKSILGLNSKGIIKGYENGAIKPNSTITREEMAAIIKRVSDIINFKGNVNANVNNINDLGSAALWSRAYILELVNLGIIKGDNLGNFNPKSNLTKGESYSLVSELINKQD